MAGVWGRHRAIAFGVEPTEFFFSIGHPMETDLGPVIYDRATKIAILQGFFHDWTELFRLDQAFAGNPRWNFDAYYREVFRGPFYEILASLKNEAFRDEREYRLVYREDPTLFNGEPFTRAPKYFRMAGSLLVPYTTSRDLVGSRIDGYEASRPSSTLAIREVMVGPHPLAQSALAGVREFLDERGYRDTPAVASDVPFR
ncbi:MAG: hypothetical protein ABI658_31930 [Acidimicrobiales bacterium]